MKENPDDINKSGEEADEPTLSDREIYEMERKVEEILADESMTKERRMSETRERHTPERLIAEMEKKGEEILADMSMTEEREGSETRETATKSRLIEELKGKGVEDQETREFFKNWIGDQEAHVGAVGTRVAGIESLRERASVLRAAGLLQEAFEELTVALDQAFEERNNDLYDAIDADMDKIEDEITGIKDEPKE